MTVEPKLRPFRVAIPQDRLDRIAERVAAFPWDAISPLPGWVLGANVEAMRRICTYWQQRYDWRTAEAALNAYPQFLAPVSVAGETLDLHFYHIEGKGPAPRPLILLHGWPGSVFEFLHLVGPLTDPEAHGGRAEDAFTLVIPSMPGYGFSAKPSAPLNPRDVAAAFAHLMETTLGYRDYMIQGGDWGSIVGSWMAYEAPSPKALHVNFHFWRNPAARPQTEEERAFFKQAQAISAREFAYFEIQSTRPQSLAFAMLDSPVGAAAYIIEKFWTWSASRSASRSAPGNAAYEDAAEEIEDRFTPDQLLTNAMLYIATDTFQTASWLYAGFAQARLGDPQIPDGARVTIPTGYAHYPGELIPMPPRSWLEQSYDIVHWAEMPRGGHFAALEEPELFLDDLRTFARLVG
ncbi:MAG: epoxide hydrolase family protein [Pseudomonadota bacterium]